MCERSRSVTGNVSFEDGVEMAIEEFRESSMEVKVEFNFKGSESEFGIKVPCSSKDDDAIVRV